MNSIFNYSFSDEIVIKFCYDLKTKIISISFDSYYDLTKEQSVNGHCIFTIKKWEKALSKLWGNDKFESFEDHFGIITEILVLKFENNILEISAINIDNSFVDYKFLNPEIEIKLLS